MDYPEPREQLTRTTTRYSEICREVWKLLELGDHWTEVLNHDSPRHNYKALNDKLQELLVSVQDYPSDDLVGYVRYSYSRRAHLPAWQPLCDAASKQCTERNSPEFTAKLYSGLIPR